MGGINYLFPPDQIHHLPRWRFVLHFTETGTHDPERLKEAGRYLEAATFKIVEFPNGRKPRFDLRRRAVDLFIEVPEAKRRSPTSLGDYESDVWRILGNMASAGYEEVYYEAIDWENPAPTEERKQLQPPKRWWQFWR